MSDIGEILCVVVMELIDACIENNGQQHDILIKLEKIGRCDVMKCNVMRCDVMMLLHCIEGMLCNRQQTFQYNAVDQTVHEER